MTVSFHSVNTFPSPEQKNNNKVIHVSKCEHLSYSTCDTFENFIYYIKSCSSSITLLCENRDYKTHSMLTIFFSLNYFKSISYSTFLNNNLLNQTLLNIV